MNTRPTNKELDAMVNDVCASDDFDCRDRIMAQIKTGRTSMRSRWLVYSEQVGLRTTWILVVFILIGVVNLLAYMVSRGPEGQFLEFGASGLGVVLTHFPYGWLALTMALLIFAIVAMKSFSWSYLFPFKLFSFLLIGGVFTAGGVAFATGINDTLYQKLIEEPGSGNSLLAKLYCLCANRTLDSDKALMGEILYVNNNELVIQTPTLDIVTVTANTDTLWLDETDPETFFMVKMLGEKTGEYSFLATHIKVHNVKGMEAVRTLEDCKNKSEWDHKREVLDQRRQAVLQPLTPVVGTAQLIRSIY